LVISIVRTISCVLIVSNFVIIIIFVVALIVVILSSFLAWGPGPIVEEGTIVVTVSSALLCQVHNHLLLDGTARDLEQAQTY
jgi:hypothetical protein